MSQETVWPSRSRQSSGSCFCCRCSLVIGHTWVSELLRPDTEICKQKMGNSHLAF